MTTPVRILANLSDGEWLSSVGSIEVHNPADTREVVAAVPSMSAEEVGAVFEAAQRGFATWRDTSPVDRGRILLRAAALLRERQDELSLTLTREMGKTLAEARGEVGKAADFFEYYGGLGRDEQGQILAHESPDVHSWTSHEPLGVVLAITPWNDPLLTPARKIAPALIAGNSVVLKPASYTPAIAIELARVLHDAALPAGVLNTVTGIGSEIGDALLAHPALRAVSFTGSNEVGAGLAASLAGRNVRLLAELGGKNASVVLADADIEYTVATIAAAAFAQAGQRCTATSRVLAHRSVLDRVRDGLVAAARGHILGSGVEPGTTMGPVVSPAQRDSIHGFIDRALTAGATRATPAVDVSGESTKYGCFVAPTVLTDVASDSEIWTEEVFGPVVALVAFDTLDEALEILNSSQYGLAAAVYTNDLGAAHAFATRADVGQVAVNLPTSGWDVHMPFGGSKASGSGHKEQGSEGLDFYRKTKTVALRALSRYRVRQ
ncbi:aldehyde dehydrogenase family protein [Rhodococcus rhodochrous]|uniref:Aldehyde dehydrogenase n=1 Tax=Rhodococcus rhodochrous KG-21 TaxID=1441923 RepID=A0A0M8PHY8_RHORH|nr:aldehyde dehydrogenase family protein [Rhodococcus rhodochrous]KOS56696.1 aldehyde dehydrogenase [Rhodococcus rhodochrous KG-21]